MGKPIPYKHLLHQIGDGVKSNIESFNIESLFIEGLYIESLYITYKERQHGNF